MIKTKHGYAADLIFVDEENGRFHVQLLGAPKQMTGKHCLPVIICDADFLVETEAGELNIAVANTLAMQRGSKGTKQMSNGSQQQ